MDINRKRHELLQVLHKKYAITNKTIVIDFNVDFETIFEKLNCSEQEYLLISPRLIDDEEIDHLFDRRPFQVLCRVRLANPFQVRQVLFQDGGGHSIPVGDPLRCQERDELVKHGAVPFLSGLACSARDPRSGGVILVQFAARSQ